MSPPDAPKALQPSKTSAQDVVDAEIRAYVYSLVSALGGAGGGNDGRYVLGDDALACLKDLRRWLSLYDQKLDRLDVARCLAEANVVSGDLLEILAAWPEEAQQSKLSSRLALSCLELLVPLTWPLDKTEENKTVNHHRHIPYLQLAQVSYKRDILHHDTAKILRAVVRIALPSIAEPLRERSVRDQSITNLVLYFLRNVAMIAPPYNLPLEWDENKVSRSATIEAFHSQDIFHFLLAISSGMGDEFDKEDVIVLEILFHLLKGVDVTKLFMEDTQLHKNKNDELREMLDKEAKMLRGYARNAPSRHNRFGTMIWVKRDDERVSTVSGQKGLVDGQRSLEMMDQSKKWNRPKARRPKKVESVYDDFDLPTHLSIEANQHLRTFVGDFLDSGFNPLFTHLRKVIEREGERLLESHKRQFFYMISWFLEAERARHGASKRNSPAEVSGQGSEMDRFSLVASVLNPETLVLLNRFMENARDVKDWHDLKASMRSFTQILLTTQEMSDSPLEEDQEIAENIQNRVFYEQSTHDRVLGILREYKDQDFAYLDACTELAHVFVRMLERYAKQNVDLQVRTKRRARKRKQAEDQPNRNVSIEGYDINEADQDDEIEGTQEHDVQEAVQLSKERKFDFNRFASKFVTQKSVDTFVAFTSFYNDLKPEQLKRAHRFFYRTAFKLSTSVLLFRVDIMALFNKMIKGPNGLDSSHPGFREWDELIRQLIKKLTKKLDQRPELFVEMLFSKISSTLYYLEYGYEKQTLKTPRIPAELEVKPGMELKEQIGIAVSVLLDQNKNDSLNWLKNVLTTAADERQSWEAEAAARQIESQNLSEGAVEAPDQPAQVASSSVPSIAVKPDNEERRIAMFKDNKMRLLMTLVGLMRLGSDEDTDAAWIVPSSLNSTEIRESLESIKTAEFSPPAFEDGKTAEDFIRRKTESKSTTTGAFGDEDEGLSGNEEDFLFPAGGPTARKADALNDLKKRRRRRNKDDDDDDDDEEEEEEVDEEVADARREARRMAEEEKRRKIKSALYVHDSDDEEDEERDKVFFAREEEGRKQHASRVRDVLLHGTTDKTKAKTKAKAKGRKRKNVDPMVGREEKRVRKMIIDESDSGAEDMDSTASGSEGPALSSDALRDEDDTTDTPISSPRQSPDMEGVENTGLAATKALEVDMAAESDEHGEDGDEDEDEDEDEDTPVLSMPRRKARAGLVVESDSE